MKWLTVRRMQEKTTTIANHHHHPRDVPPLISQISPSSSRAPTDIKSWGIKGGGVLRGEREERKKSSSPTPPLIPKQDRSRLIVYLPPGWKPNLDIGVNVFLCIRLPSSPLQSNCFLFFFFAAVPKQHTSSTYKPEAPLLRQGRRHVNAGYHFVPSPSKPLDIFLVDVFRF